MWVKIPPEILMTQYDKTMKYLKTGEKFYIMEYDFNGLSVSGYVEEALKNTRIPYLDEKNMYPTDGIDHRIKKYNAYRGGHTTTIID